MNTGMKHFILFIMAILSWLSGFAQGGYDPENPGDPNPYRKLTVLASPKAGGGVNSNYKSQAVVGQTVYCYATKNKYYDFVHWLQNGEIVSPESPYSFVMPDEDVEITAVFELNYNPESPDDPQEAKNSHRLTLTASPGNGGSFNIPAIKLPEGESTNIYAYSNEDYRFEEWLLDGVLVSTKNPLMIKMGDKDMHYTARFSYSPVNPADPNANLFNPGNGQMTVDRFEQGSLSNAVYSLLDDDYDYSDVQSLLVCGMMDGSDFGVMCRLSNCSVIDLSRTNGYAEIPSYSFESMESLTELILPSCINTIGWCAFTGCKNLSVITCYAVIPPSLDYGVFDGVDKAVVIKVPAQSVDLYKNAPGWKNFTILPADKDVFSISVSLPSDATDGRYKNMSIELLNTSNGQRYKYLITDKTEYVFGNLLSSTKYSVAVKNARNEVLGEITYLEIVDQDLTATFQSLRQPQNVTVKVITPDGSDVTSDVTVKWFNDANELLQQGPTLSGVLENSAVSYTVALSSQLLQYYLPPSQHAITVSSQNTAQTCTLEKLGRSILTGKVCDTDGKVINTATITVSQNINGSYISSEIVQCDNNGSYELEVPDVPLKFTVSANGYIGQTKELQSASAGIGDIVLEKTTGITIYPSYTFQESVSIGQEIQTSDRFSDDSNIAYRIEDLNGNEIPGCMYQQGSIILPENIKIGDEVNVTVYSKVKKFNDVSQTIAINSKNVYVSLPIVEYGGISITSNDDAVATNICMLYDKDGIQVRKAIFRNNVSFGDLPDGQYTLISMRKSSLLGSISNLSSFQETQLVQGGDYLLNTVNVASGKITDIAIGGIPDLDETKLYYTDGKETYFMPNKSQVTVGNYVTLKAKLTVKDEYADAIDAATLIVDIPSGCEFVDNSVISGSGYLGYEYADNRLSVPIQHLSDVVRFCIVPLNGGDCKPAAFVRLIIDNEEILQPIGSAYFEAKNFGLAAPQKTSKTNIVIRGTATADSEVLIYDNETLVGSTYSLPNGQWSVKLSLHKPYSRSIHDLYGEVITPDGKRLLTQSKTVDHDQSYVDLSKVTMVYNNINIVFDHLNGKNTANSYSYVPGKSDFTFIADFTENNPEKISNVIIKVLASDGSVRSLPADYNVTSGRWITRTTFADSNKLPVNATVDFDISVYSNPYCEEAFNDQIQGLINATNYLLEEFENNVSLNVSVDEDDRLEGRLIYKDNVLSYKAQILDYNYVYNQLMNEKQFYLYEANGDKIFYNVESTNTKMVYTVIDSAEKLALSIIIESANESYYIQKRAMDWSWISSMRQTFNNGSFLRQFTGFMGNLLDIFGVLEYTNVRGDFNLMMDNALRYADNFLKLDKQTMSLILAKCQNGDYRLGRGQMQLAEIDKNALSDRTSRFSDKYYQYLTDYKWALGWNIAGNIASLGIGKLIGTASKLIKEGGSVFKWYAKHINGNTNVNTAGDIITNSLGIAYGGLQSGASEVINPAFYDFNGIRDKLWSWSNIESQEIVNEYIKLNEAIKRAYHECPEDEEEDEEEEEDNNDDNFPAPPVTPSIDPSGYVYEAVPSNRIQGVTATAYYKQQSEDMYGDITETTVVWDATPFGQENPLITDEEGKYAWDVPAGMWQVRFEKEGYEPAQSAWLPVPPPQLDVNIAMTQAKQPEIKTVHAYSDGVTIEFDKFMLPASLSIGNITVTQNGSIVSGTIEASDIELAANGNAFCSKIEFKPDELLADGEATLFVSKAVKSYANINMSEDFMQTFTIEPRVSKIRTNQNIEINSGSTMKLFASILPATAASGKAIAVESLNPLIASVSTDKVETDAKGNISFDVSGLIIGSTSIKLSIEDYDIEAIVDVNVLDPRDENQVATPYASIESGEVDMGTEVYLYCETENATIYYTTDGSCPCDVNRQRYDGMPVVIDKEMTLKVMAEADGMIESEIAEYQYSIDATGIGEIQIDEDLSIYPLPLGEYLNISNGNNAIDAVSIFNLNGNLMLHSDKTEKQVTLNVGYLTPGIYILNVRTNGQSIMKKVIKR